MITEDSVYTSAIQSIQWMMTNYQSTITIDVKTLVVGQEYYINTLWQKISYTAQAGDTSLIVLTALKDAWVALDVTASIVNDKLTLTKSTSNYFFFYELSDNLKFEPFLDGKIIIQDQNSPQPNKTYLTIKLITGFNDNGGDNVIYNTDTTKYYLSNQKNYTLNIQAHGIDSSNYLNYLKKVFSLPECVTYCREKNISFANPQDIDDISTIINNGFEKRHNLDILCNSIDNMNLSMVSALEATINIIKK